MYVSYFVLIITYWEIFDVQSVTTHMHIFVQAHEFSLVLYLISGKKNRTILMCFSLFEA